MKNNVAKKMRKKGVGKTVTCPQVLVVCYMYIAIAFKCDNDETGHKSRGLGNTEPTSLPTKQRDIL
jgi:hypothetical protein